MIDVQQRHEWHAIASIERGPMHAVAAWSHTAGWLRLVSATAKPCVRAEKSPHRILVHTVMAEMVGSVRDRACRAVWVLPRQKCGCRACSWFKEVRAAQSCCAGRREADTQRALVHTVC